MTISMTIIYKLYKGCPVHFIMSFELLRNLQYGEGADCASGLGCPPTRIVPISYRDGLEIFSPSDSLDIKKELEIKKVDSELKYNKIFSFSGETKTISFENPRLGENIIICNGSKKLPEPSVYFYEKNSFVKSYLYLSSVDFYNNCNLPKKSDEIVKNFIRSCFKKYMTGVGEVKGDKERDKEREKIGVGCKKLIQNLFSKGDELDTDPSKNSYFSYIYDNILKSNESILVIRTTKEGYYLDSIPDIPNLLSSQKKDYQNICYIFLELPCHRFCPYGKSYY